jgi:hypothetical protein
MLALQPGRFQLGSHKCDTGDCIIRGTVCTDDGSELAAPGGLSCQWSGDHLDLAHGAGSHCMCIVMLHCIHAYMLHFHHRFARFILLSPQLHPRLRYAYTHTD